MGGGGGVMWLWMEGTLRLSLGGVVAADQMRQRSLNNEEVDGKTRYVAFTSTAGIKNGKYCDIRSHPDGFYLTSQRGAHEAILHAEI